MNLNSKNEYFKHSVQRIEIVRDGWTVQCEYYSRKFNNLKELEIHEIDFHIKYNCKKCEYQSFGKKDLNQHISSIHDIQM